MRNSEEQVPNANNQLPALQSATGTSVAVFDGNLHQPSEDDEIDLRALWRIVLRYRKLIGIIFAVVVTTALLMTLLMRPMYTASTLVEINTDGNSLVEFQDVGDRKINSWEFVPTQARILESAAIATEVVKRLKLTKEPEFNGELRQRGLMNGISNIIGLFSSGDYEYNELSEIESATARYLGRLSVSTVRQSTLVNLNFESFSPELAAKIVNEHAQAYIDLSNQRRYSSTSGAKAFLAKEKSSVQARLETSEKQLNDFARKNGVVDVEDRNNIMMARLSELSSSLSEVQSQRVDAETKYIQSKTANSQQLVAVFDDVLIKALREEQSGLKSQYLELSKIYKPKYPAMVQLKAKIQEVEENIQSQARNIVGGLKTNYEQLVLNESQLKKELAKLKGELLDLQDRAVTYNILKREWEANKELYSGILDRLKQVGVAAGTELNVASIVDSASVPRRASSPRLKLNLLIAAFLGLVGGLGAAFLLAMLDNSINDVEQLQHITQLGHLGVAPVIDFDNESADGDGFAQTKMFDTIAHREPSSAFAESIQSVRTSLSYARAGGFPKSIMVTSSLAGEGKSTIAMNLAISAAKSGKSVIVVEADLRKSRHYKVFGVPAAPGLSDYLVGTEDAKPYRVREISDMAVLVAGSKTPNPVDLLSSAQMRKLIKQYEEHYDLVVVDCPPVLGLADSIAMSMMVKAVLFVVSAHTTPQDVVKNAIARLRMVNAPLIGTVLNKVQARYAGYDYSYYNYDYSLSSESDEYDQTREREPG